MSKSDFEFDDRLGDEINKIDWLKLTQCDAIEFSRLLGARRELMSKPAYDKVAYMTTFGGVIGIVAVTAACWIAFLDGYTTVMVVLLAQTLRGLRLYLKYRKRCAVIEKFNNGLLDRAMQFPKLSTVSERRVDELKRQ